MGLIHQANRIQPPLSATGAGKKKTGLLNRIRGVCSYDILLDSFRSLLSAGQAEKGGLLYPGDDGSLVLLLNTGFDLTTVRRFCPDSTEFRSRLVKAADWNEISGTALDHFQTFFSSRERDSLSSLYIKPVGTNADVPLYIVMADSLLTANRRKINLIEAERNLPLFLETIETRTPTLSALALSGAVNQSRDSMKAHAQSAFDSKRIATLARLSFSALFPDMTALQSDPDIQAVYFAMVHRIARQAGQSNILYIRNNFDLHVVLFTSMPVDIELYFFQLMKPLEKIFGTYRISRIAAGTVGIAPSVGAVMEFLTGEA